MDKVELFYFYKMYHVIMTLLQSDNSKAVVDALNALNEHNLDIGKCYEIYHENLIKIEDIKYNEIARRDFERKIYEQCDKENREEK